MATATKKNPAPPPPRADEAGGAEPGGLARRPGLRRRLPLPGLAQAGGDQPGDPGGGAGLRHLVQQRYGMAAAQEWIYQTKGFALLLAFLGTNILCAALIRYPWTKRQTGFVITHAGLLIVLGGSW